MKKIFLFLLLLPLILECGRNLNILGGFKARNTHAQVSTQDDRSDVVARANIEFVLTKTSDIQQPMIENAAMGAHSKLKMSKKLEDRRIRTVAIESAERPNWYFFAPLSKYPI
ncbi:MAG: hypothetical protein WKF87_10155 [Chryseolinea sp.]